MPYDTNRELTEKVNGTDKLSDRKKRQFRHVFNRLIEDGEDESTAYAKSWGAVKNTAKEGRIRRLADKITLQKVRL